MLDAVLAAPHDDAPRLIYANWLQQRGNPRGDFIKVQIALANAPDEAATKALRLQEANLLEDHEVEWLSAVGLTRTCDVVHFARGFIDTVSFESLDSFAHAQERVWADTPISGMFFAGLGADDAFVRELVDSPRMRRLGRLGVEENDLGPDAARAIAASPHLRELRELWIGDNE
ncbi:MAG TPA: TIGR02996 domain-containing protein, partial [Polyangia bacterium]|nr:TIGR02996 domain-containing protein [Polyangia bacterium]